MENKRLGKEQTIQKIKHYCAYQERCHAEVKEKLYGFGMYKTEIDEIISNLIEENYLNEERFAKHFAGGRFRMKYWGRVKIKYELKQKRVSDYCIRKALLEIDDDEYIKRLNKLAEDKLASLKSEKNIFIKKKKLQGYLLQKGYESELVQEMVNAIGK